MGESGSCRDRATGSRRTHNTTTRSPIATASSASSATETHGILAYAYARAGDLAKAGEVLARMLTANGGRLPATGVVAAAMLDMVGS